MLLYYIMKNKGNKPVFHKLLIVFLNILFTCCISIYSVSAQNYTDSVNIFNRKSNYSNNHKSSYSIHPQPSKQLNNYLRKKLDDEKSYSKDSCAGYVIVKFTITKEGNVENPRVVSGFGNSCDDLALDIVKNMPQWKPAKIQKSNP